MKTSSLFSLALAGGASLLLAAVVPGASAQQLADDPPSYFGGVNHQSYLDWVSTNNITEKYDSSVFIPSREDSLGAAVHWSVDEEYFYVAVAARATGWVGFGLSDAGGMYGSDMALFTASRPDEIIDAHVVSEPFPKTDDCQQDWVLVSSQSATGATAEARQATGQDDGDFLMFEARRKLDTDDPQDIALVRDNLLSMPEQRIIAAWGDTGEVSYHGATDVARGSIRLFQAEVDEPSFDALMERDADGSFFVGANSFMIPANDTTYETFCVTRQQLIDQGVPDTTDRMSVIGFRPILDEGPSAAYVHHYIVTGLSDTSDECDQSMDLVYVWAPGDGPFALPDFLGGNLFGEDGFQGFSIETHYDNPRMDEGVVDSSGVEIYFSTTPRDIEMGVLQVGDPFVSLFGQPVGEGYNMHQFDCPGSCSDFYLQQDGGGEPVTVVREYLHMHVAGARVTNDQIRDGTVMRTASTEVWDFNSNGNIAVKQDPYEILPGDSFRTTCYFDGLADTVFGLSSRQEMCISFLYYYPRKSFKVATPNGEFNIPWICGHGIDWLESACLAEHSGADLEDETGLNREFGKQKAQCLVGSEPAIDMDVGASPAPAPNDVATPEIPVEFLESDEATLVPAPMGLDVPQPAPAAEPASSVSGAPTSLAAFSSLALVIGIHIAGFAV